MRSTKDAAARPPALLEGIGCLANKAPESPARHQTMASYYPIALRLEGRSCLVVGGGAVALRRVRSLLDAGAHVVVRAPKVHPQLEELGARGVLTVQRAEFDGCIPEGTALVIATTDRDEVNLRVVEAARRAGILCADAAEPHRGDFVVPSCIRRGDLILAVTTGGQSPALAARIARELAEQYGPEYEEYVGLLGEMRRQVLSIPIADERRRDVLRKLAEDAEILELVQQGRLAEARERAQKCISCWLG